MIVEENAIDWSAYFMIGGKLGQVIHLTATQGLIHVKPFRSHIGYINHKVANRSLNDLEVLPLYAQSHEYC